MRSTYFSASAIAAVLPLLAATASASCAHLTHLSRRGPGAPFSYSSPTGPENWHELSPANSACGTGHFQSPIDLSAPYNLRNHILLRNLLTFSLSSPSSEIELENLGTTMMGYPNGTMQYEGVEYELVQFHVHTPSEHYMPPDWRIESRSESQGWEGEVHFVFQSEESDLAVVGLLLSADPALDGQDSGVVDSVLESFSQIPTKGDVTVMEGVEFASVVTHIKDNPIYAYSGSLTTPPCSEGVQWLLSSIPLRVSAASISSAQDVMGENNRPLQDPLGTGGDDEGEDDGSGAPEASASPDDGSGAPEVTATASTTGRVRVTSTVYVCNAVPTDGGETTETGVATATGPSTGGSVTGSMTIW